LSAKAHILAFVMTAHVLLTIGHGQTAPLFHFIEKPGPYPVGLRVVEQYDYSRIYHSTTDDLGKPYQGERARPLQTLIWYPAIKSDNKAMTVGDYGISWPPKPVSRSPGWTIRHKTGSKA
jgi:hypothetical protein